MDRNESKPVLRMELEPVCMALARVIRRRREACGLSLGRLAERTLLSQQVLSFVETGERIPTIDTLARISRALGVRCSLLLLAAER